MASTSDLYFFNHGWRHGEQLGKCLELSAIVKAEKHCTVARRINLLRERGYEPKMMRVRFGGGVGSYRFMLHGKKFRLQVAAAVLGKDTKPRLQFGKNFVMRRKRKKYFRYALCIEI